MNDTPKVLKYRLNYNKEKIENVDLFMTCQEFYNLVHGFKIKKWKETGKKLQADFEIYKNYSEKIKDLDLIKNKIKKIIDNKT